ncbi:copper amine oxidase N-terminal domain-containing protein [Paenibacillus nanensis]|uniref:Copper amine oxidase N-terminal domain-containing protein n=1 Tax=Paenibacillus nanensis TaxID=393251 RepID=A0A3A1USQ0_9BACL|nr:copper amine oxidase N-terminal domain-containing protein [Paenibacillus nanensis]RIX51558.1 copper amine oxidase N-terminal domain-containing protein [Paenibacillus nanensis]
MFRKKLGAAVVSSVMLMSIVAGGPLASAAADASGIEVKEFQFLDKEYDRIRLDGVGPDGTRDGHLRVLFDAGAGTEVKAITLKTADSSGNDVNHGMWKTWKADKVDNSYLLVVVQEGKMVNTEFTSTLGTFKGMTELELYASDNNGMKPGEYYYLEIETGKGVAKTPIAPYAENAVSYAPVAIREFVWKDLTSDETGVAEFGPDGTTDGHFKMKLHIAQKTEILAVILHATDENGKDTGGLWRTNRAGVGWLLGIAQGKNVLTPAFQKDETTPIGSFKGVLDLDIYANNNGSIKDGGYYVIEVETQYGTVKSDPVKFGDSKSKYVNNAPFGFKSIGLTINSLDAYIDEKAFKLDAAPFKLEGRTMVPIRFIAEALGAKVEWDAADRRVTLTKDGSKIELIIDQKEAYVNGETTVLDAPAVIRNKVTLVPVRFVSESLDMKVFYDDGEILVTDAPNRN